MAFDVIIKGGQVIDGTGKPRAKVDVALTGDRIAAIGDLADAGAAAARTIDATGFVVTPGFIDMHSHSDQTILQYPGGESSIGQGITTSVGGQCGSSLGPLGKHINVSLWGANWKDKVAPAKYYAENTIDLEVARRAAKEYDGFDIDWTTFGGWLDRVAASKPGINLVPLVGHGAVRTSVMGKDYKRHAKPDEVAAMKRYVAQAMDEGAAGISNGMDYPPGVFASPEESVEVIGEAVRHGGFYSTHWRRTGLRQGAGNPGLIDGLREGIEIGRRTGARTEVAHLSAGYLISPRPTPKIAQAAAEETLAVVEEAIKGGVDLTFDCIPNHLTGGTTHQRWLAATLAPWFKEAGSFEQLARNLKAADARREIKDYIYAGKWYPLNPLTTPNWTAALTVFQSTVMPELSGKSIAEITAARGGDPLDVLMDVLVTDPRAAGGMRRPFALDVNLRVFYNHPRAMVGCDTLLVDDTFGPDVPPYQLPNHNTFGGMARFIRLYALGLLGLEEGIRRLTSLPAERLNLPDRGVIAPGRKADLVVFRPEEVQDNEDELETRRYPKGYRWVFVNGVAAMEAGQLTHSRSGEVLRRK